MRHFIVRYEIRKGLGPEWMKRESEVSFDDIDPEATDNYLKKMAIREVESRLYRSEDYRIYGTNWRITEVEEFKF